MNDKRAAQFNDMLGKPISAGDVVAYAVRKGNSAGLYVGVIIETFEKDLNARWRSGREWATRISMWVTNLAWSDKFQTAKGVYEDIRKTTLQTTDRIVTIHPDSLGQCPLADFLRKISHEIKHGHQ